MASTPGAKKKSRSRLSGDGADKDKLIDGLKNRIAVLENELHLKQENASMDDTERKRTDKAVWESEEKYRAIVETAGEGIVIALPDGPYLFVNQRMVDMLGYPVGDILGKSSVDFTFDDRIPQVFQARDTLRNNIRIQGEFKFRRKDGSVLWTMYNATPMHNEKGEHVATLAMHSDITERKLAEEALKQSEQHLNDILSSIQDGFFELDREYRYTYINQKAAMNSGLEPEDHIGNCIWDMFPYARGTKFEAVYRKVMETGRPAQFEIKSPSMEQYYDISVYPSVTGISVFWRDITGRKQAEEAVRKSMDELERRVRERTAELESSNEKLKAEVMERQRGEEALRDGKANLQALLDAAHESIFLMGPDGTVVAINDCTARRVGSTPENLVGKNLYERLSPELAKSRQKYVEEILRTGKPARWEDVRDGRIMDNSMYPIFSADGKVVRLAGFSRDMTEERRATEALRESEGRFRALADNIPNMAWMAEVDGRIFWFNKQWYDYTGTKLEDVLGWGWLKVQHPDYAEKVKVKWLSNIEAGRPHDNVAYLRGRDGNYRWFLTRVVPIRDERGNIFRWFGTNTDITERMQAEEERERLLRDVEEQRGRLQAILDAIPVGVWVADAMGKLVMINDAAYNIWGGGPSEVNRVEEYFVYKIWRPDTGDRVPEEGYPIARALRGETVRDMVVDFERFDGIRGTQLASAAPIKDSQGNIIGGVAVALDITMLKRTEEELKVAKQQAELYLDLMGHDINNMHQVALGYLELARDLPAGADQMEYLDKSAEVLQRSTKLISNVRKLQKIREVVFQAQDIDVCELLEEVHSEYKSMPSKTIRLNLNGHGKCLVRANELLHDVFANLVNNAIKHTRDGTEINVGLDVKEDDGRRYYRVIVDDNGPGIPDNSKERVFNRMHLGSARGMGLGLYLVRSLVNSYSGRVWAEDRVKGDHMKGARFVVMLPAVDD